MLDDEEKEFAERAARRLEAVAGRLEQESRRLGVVAGEKTLARAQELRVAAHMVRDEGRVVALRDRPFPQGAQERDETGLRAS